MLREVLARFGIQIDGAPLARFGRSITGAIANVRVLGGLLAGSFIVGAIKNAISDMVHLGDETAKTARSLGLTGQEYQSLAFAANRSGVSTQGMTTSLTKLMRAAADTRDGMQTSVDVFRDAGIAFRDTNGELLSGPDLMLNVADAMERQGNATERVALAQRLMGRSGRQLIPMLLEGRDAVQELFERFERLGGGMGDDFLAMTEDADDAILDFDVAMMGLKSTIAVQWLPTFSRMTFAFAEFVADLRRLNENTDVVKIGLIAIGAIAVATGLVLAASFAVPLLIVGLLAAAFLFAILAVDDFITFLEGGDSVIGDFLDTWFGRGSAQAAVQWISAIAQVMNNDLVAAWGNVQSSAQTVWGVLVTVFSALREWPKMMAETIRLSVEQVFAFIARVRAAIADVRNAVATVANFVGIDVGVQPGSAPTAEVSQNVSVSIQGGAGEGEDIESRVRRAIRDANASVFGTARRALTQVAGG